MAGCTVKEKSYGYWCGDTGTDNTVITPNAVRVKRIVCVTAASASSLKVYDGGGDMIVDFLSTPTYHTQVFDFGSQRFNGLTVTIATTTVDRVLIIVE